jgi:hypothetical protein
MAHRSVELRGAIRAASPETPRRLDRVLQEEANIRNVWVSSGPGLALHFKQGATLPLADGSHRELALAFLTQKRP